MAKKRRTKKYRGGRDSSVSSDLSDGQEEQFKKLLETKKQFDSMPTQKTIGLGIIAVVGVIMAGIFLKKKL